MYANQQRNKIQIGATVDIVLKKDQPTGKLTRGKVMRILTNKKAHPRGIKVMLTDGQVGRVQHIIDVVAAESTPMPERGTQPTHAQKHRIVDGIDLDAFYGDT